MDALFFCLNFSPSLSATPGKRGEANIRHREKRSKEAISRIIQVAAFHFARNDEK